MMRIIIAGIKITWLRESVNVKMMLIMLLVRSDATPEETKHEEEEKMRYNQFGNTYMTSSMDASSILSLIAASKHYKSPIVCD
jgi:hypothetical protein